MDEIKWTTDRKQWTKQWMKKEYGGYNVKIKYIWKRQKRKSLHKYLTKKADQRRNNEKRDRIKETKKTNVVKKESTEDVNY